jgi:ATP-dependent DNA helicase RecQ
MDIKSQPPLHRFREFALFIDRLREIEGELRTAPALIALAGELRAGQDNRWWRRLSRLLDDWQQEAGDGELPVSMFLEYLFEILREQRRDRIAEDAVFLGTVHAAKGLEFSHVFILDNGWQRAVRQGSLEEERRLYYVGMTRARETLTLLQNKSGPNPFSPNLSGEFLVRTSHEQSEQSGFQPCLYTILGLKDIDLGYAGRKSPENPIHDALTALEPGSPLALCRQENRFLLLSANRRVAALSKAASTHWADRTENIISIQVVAMIRRSAGDGDPAYKPLYRTDQWEVPLVEITHRV